MSKTVRVLVFTALLVLGGTATATATAQASTGTPVTVQAAPCMAC